jgi:lactoylglutathione lyase
MKNLFIAIFIISGLSSGLVSAQSNKSKTVINHIAVYVADLAKSTHFYQNIVGLDTIPEPFHDGRHTWFSIGCNAQLHLIKGATTVTTHDKNTHLCFSVPSVPAFINLLNKNHIGYENWLGEKQAVTRRVDGVSQIYFTDPEGYWIEINDAGQ